MGTNSSNELPESIGYGDFGSDEDGGQETETTTESADELDELANDMSEESESDDPLDRDLGYGNEDDDEDEDPEESGEDQGSESEEGDSQEEEEEVEGEESEEAEETEEAETEDEGEEATEEEDELIYDAERDFPDSDVQPTKYNDRIALNSGFTEKVRYLREKKAQLEEAGSRLGAIPLPDYFGDNEGKIDEVVDREAFSSLSDEEAKKAIHDMDVAIKRTTSKLDTVEAEQQQQQQKQQVSQEYEEAVDNLAGALDNIGLSIDEAKNMQIDEINARADEAIAELEDEDNAHEFIENNSAQEWRRAIQELEDAKRTVSEFPDKERKYREQAKSDNNGQQFDPELAKETYEGFTEDRPEHAVFEGETKAREEDFLEYVRGKIERQEITPPQHEREWLKQADNYVDMIEEEKKAYQQRKKKSSKKDKSGKSKTADDSPVKKDKDKKPTPNDVRGQRSRRDALTTSDIDNDLDRLAQEMN